MEREYTIDSYLGSDYQLKFLWQILTEPEFAQQIFPFLVVDYWDDPNYKRYFIVLKQYHDEYGKVPNLQNKSVYGAISKYKLSDSTDEEILLSLTEKIKQWNDRVINRELDHDGEIVQKHAFSFIKQGEYANMADLILSKVQKGQISDDTLVAIEDRIKKISEIGTEEDDGTNVFEDIDGALEKTFRNPIPTGIKELDHLMGGGLGRGEMGIVLAPSGVGKSTILTKFANEAYKYEKNVLHIIFEDIPRAIKRKHYTIWSGIPLNEIDERVVEVREKVLRVHNEYNAGKLIIKRFPQENTTIPKLRKWIDRYKKKNGIKFDIIILDYLDCIDPHKKATDQNQAELAIVKAFESMAAEYDIPCWTALQTNRSGFNKDRVDHSQMGGNIKRAQKTHFLMSVAKTQEQKEAGLANIDILKARFASDGQFFEDVIFDNNKVKIDFSGSNRKRYSDDTPPTPDVDELNNKLTPMSEVLSDEELNEQSEIDPNKELESLKSTPKFDNSQIDTINNMLATMSKNQNIRKE